LGQRSPSPLALVPLGALPLRFDALGFGQLSGALGFDQLGFGPFEIGLLGFGWFGGDSFGLEARCGAVPDVLYLRLVIERHGCGVGGAVRLRSDVRHIRIRDDAGLVRIRDDAGLVRSDVRFLHGALWSVMGSR
jgi:hypothetical protein